MLSFFGPLDRKLIRDLWRIRGQALAIALVIASGVSLFIMSDGMLSSLDETMRAYYERYRFADIFAPVKRAPDRTLAEISEIEGVAAAEGRIVAPVLFDVEGFEAPISGQAVSLPSFGEARLNAVHIVEGRMIDPAREDEILLLSYFARSHELRPGDSISATLSGAKRTLLIAGLVLSPEFTYAIAPGELAPDDQRYGVLWMGREGLGKAFDLDGAYNNLLLALARGADEDHVIDRLDRLLEPYGATGAFPRADQLSNNYLTEELKQLDTMGKILPPIFLAVAAFLLNIVIARIIDAEREEIGLIKAFGYTNMAVAVHYLKFVLAIALLGGVVGCLLGTYLGRTLASMYQIIFKFPFLLFSAKSDTYLIGMSVSAVAAGVGAIFSLQRAFALTPATAMRPPTPPNFTKIIGLENGIVKHLDQPTRMILRRILRQPMRILLTSIGVAAAMALSVTMRFNTNAINYMVDVSFNVIDRHDIAVSFVEPMSFKTIYELRRLGGVIAVEPFRSVPVRMFNGHIEKLAAITGLIDEPTLSRPVDASLQLIDIRRDGVVMSKMLAEIMGVGVGDNLTLEVLEGRQPIISVPVVGIAETMLGTPVYGQISALSRSLTEGPRVSGAYLQIDTDMRSQLYDTLKDMPMVAGVALRHEAQAAFQEMIDESQGVFRHIMTIFAIIIAGGVVYNSARIALAERARDLASLRVLGFTKGETAYVLLGELVVMILLALPIGSALGYGLSWYIATAFSNELYQIPLLIKPDAFAYATTVVLVSALLSGLLVFRDVSKLDMVTALKTRE